MVQRRRIANCTRPLHTRFATTSSMPLPSTVTFSFWLVLYLFRQTNARLQVQAKPKVNEDLGLVSSTAKRILRTLEGMSTPLSVSANLPQSSVTALFPDPLLFIYVLGCSEDSAQS